MEGPSPEVGKGAGVEPVKLRQVLAEQLVADPRVYGPYRRVIGAVAGYHPGVPGVLPETLPVEVKDT